ncbi:Hypothetical predicted protein [Octopus vulgaris]|uniref:Uncharacterized protein n=1 Tax=Octopus vulgaris TaxID=6645 RepID=A0AA36APV3_OCTVU|nr:Hypothetical predicted protein [Octopus vulgaris]
MNSEQRMNLKFLVRLEKTSSQRMCGDNTMSRTSAFERHKKLKEVCEEVQDDSRGGGGGDGNGGDCGGVGVCAGYVCVRIVAVV